MKIIDDNYKLLNVAKTKCIEDCTKEGTRLSTDRKTCVTTCTANSKN